MIEPVEITQVDLEDGSPGLDKLDQRHLHPFRTKPVIEPVEITQADLEDGSPGLDKLDQRAIRRASTRNG